ncbi:MAG TPA: flagellin [Alphaproteobacteria bacterium]|nr:flagellin [Alphaproteobacteria bacterium]
MTYSISSVGLQLQVTTSLQNQQNTLALLNQQLASGVQHSDLTGYTPPQAQSLLNYQSIITQRQAYISGMQSVSPRLSVYDSTMTDIESLTQQASTLATQNQTYDANTASQIQAQAKAYLQQMQDDLNQQVGGRYIYAGSRYTTQPVTDLTTLGAPTLPFTPTTSPTLTDYDTEYNPPTTTTDAAAYAQDSVTVDSSFSVQYGVTSNSPGFQQVIAGLRLINAAASQSNPNTFNTDMIAAAKLLNQGLSAVQGVHAGVAGNINILKQQTDQQNSDITALQNQISGIQNVDTTTLGTELTLLQTQLQASYSSTATIIQNSILKYL